MNKAGITLLMAGILAYAGVSSANDFTTVARVHYVQDCIASNQGKMNVYEATHKCSCVIDKIAESFTQRQYEDADAGFQFANLPGDRGAEFRDDADIIDGISTFKKLHAEAYKSCRIRR
jgi:hypothetical protein